MSCAFELGDRAAVTELERLAEPREPRARLQAPARGLMGGLAQELLWCTYSC